MLKMFAVTATAALVMTACGGSAAPDKASDADKHHGVTPKCAPSGNEIAVTAQNSAFNTDCLAAPADTAFKITLDNRDNLAHNVAIHEVGKESSPLFAGEIFTGPGQKIYEVNPIAPGTYGFHCQVHPTMTGTLVVK